MLLQYISSEAFSDAQPAVWQIVIVLTINAIFVFRWLLTKACSGKACSITAANSGKSVPIIAEEHAWLKAEFGKYKYCGLRNNPFSNEPAPVYNFSEPPAMLRPALTPIEAQGIVQLRSRLSDLSALGFRLDDWTLQRFLRARRGNVEQAALLARKAQSMQEEYNLRHIYEDGCLEKCFRLLQPWWHSGGFLGHSKDGHPVCLERLGWCKFHRLCKLVPFEVLLKLDQRHLLTGVATSEEDAERRGTEPKGVLAICDAGGLDVDDLRVSTMLTFKKLVNSRDTLTPEITWRVLIVNAPVWATRLWGMVSKLALTPETAEKVQIASSEEDSLALIRKYVDNDVIPAYLGGSRKIDGDAECRKLLAPGGPVPEDVINRLLEIIQEGNNEKHVMKCVARDNITDVSSPNSKDRQEIVAKPAKLVDEPAYFGFCGWCRKS